MIAWMFLLGGLLVVGAVLAWWDERRHAGELPLFEQKKAAWTPPPRAAGLKTTQRKVG